MFQRAVEAAHQDTVVLLEPSAAFAELFHAPLPLQVKTNIGQPFLDTTDWRRLTGLQELSLQVRTQHPCGVLSAVM